ncbi:hypothetical protein Pcinc_034907 [Petrolisthes cinctipes]|uniref:Uncharacterized protein n=1 Tax=Petrolisthes cinctipes TaxID=88211 RepID=A0AAE1BZE3_PETCI|nr:hypothetical protein Pcinc_034907 [Petrolisthes cinctipes]
MTSLYCLIRITWSIFIFLLVSESWASRDHVLAEGVASVVPHSAPPWLKGGRYPVGRIAAARRGWNGVPEGRSGVTQGWNGMSQGRNGVTQGWNGVMQGWNGETQPGGSYQVRQGEGVMSGDVPREVMDALPRAISMVMQDYSNQQHHITTTTTTTTEPPVIWSRINTRTVRLGTRITATTTPTCLPPLQQQLARRRRKGGEECYAWRREKSGRDVEEEKVLFDEEICWLEDEEDEDVILTGEEVASVVSLVFLRAYLQAALTGGFSLPRPDVSHVEWVSRLWPEVNRLEVEAGERPTSLLASFISIIDPLGMFGRTEDDGKDVRRRLMVQTGGRKDEALTTMVKPNFYSSIFGDGGGGGGGRRGGGDRGYTRRRGMVQGDGRRDTPPPYTPPTTTTEPPSPSPSPPLVYFPDGGSGECEDFAPSGFNTYSFLSFLFSVANLVGHVSTRPCADGCFGIWGKY